VAIPNYAYLNLQIPGLAEIITVEAKTQCTLDYEQNSIELAATIAALRELYLNALPSLTGPTMPSSIGAFKVPEDPKAVQIDAEDPAKTVQIGADLSPKQLGELIDFLRCNKDIFAWSPA
jgi:hypothetical protein